MRKIILLTCFVFSVFKIYAQHPIGNDELRSALEDGQRLFSYGYTENNPDSVHAAEMLIEKYVEVFNEKSMRAVAEDVENPWSVFDILARIYDWQNNSEILTLYDNTVYPYYQQQGNDDFEQYFAVASNVVHYLTRPQQPVLGLQQQIERLDLLSTELHNQAVATNEKSLILAVSKYMVAWSKSIKGDNVSAAKWLEDARVAGIPYLEKDNGSFYFLLYLESLSYLIQSYAMTANYAQGIEVSDQLISLSQSTSSQFLLTGLCFKAELLIRKGDIASLAPLIGQIDSVCTFGQQINPVLLDRAKQAVEQYQISIQQSTGFGLGNNNDLASLQSDLAAMEDNPPADLFYYNNLISQCFGLLLQKDQLKDAKDMLDHSKSIINDKYSHIPYATRFVEGLYAALWHALGNTPQALNHLHKSEQMFELAADHGMQYIEMMGDYFIPILQAAGDMAYTKLYLDKLNFFVENNFNGNSAEIPEIKLIKAAISTYYFSLGYTDIATSQIEKLVEGYGIDQQGYQWDMIRLMLAYINVGKNNFEKADWILRHNLKLATSEKSTVSTLNGLILANCNLGNHDAISFFETFEQMQRQQINRVIKSFDLNERQSYWGNISQQLSMLSNLVMHTFSDSSEACELAYNTALYVKSMQDRKIKRHKLWKEVAWKLEDNEVAIEFVSIPDQSGKKVVRYGALVLRKGYTSPRYIDLCPIEDIDNIWRDMIHTDKKLINKLYSPSDKLLYNLVWSKIVPLLQRGDVVYFSTVGTLDRINHSIVSNGQSQLGAIYSMNHLSSTAIISELKKLRWQSGGRAVIYGGIAYELNADQMSEYANKYKHVAMAERSEVTRGGISRGALNDELEGTLEEAIIIDSVLKQNGYTTKLLTGSEANEESFKSLDGQAPQILHIGTHGFMLSTNTDTEQHFNIISDGIDGKTMQRNLMQYCGLRMAGSNNAWRGIEVPPELEDGILTAYEISHVDLTGCNLVVLSACESGLGFTNYYGNDIGLLRALKIAGVGTVIASLWEVPDKATSLLMQNMFTFMAQGTAPRKALSKAQDIVRRIYPDPYYWAAFILLDGLN